MMKDGSAGIGRVVILLERRESGTSERGRCTGEHSGYDICKY